MRKKGFTLIELVVTLSVSAIIFAFVSTFVVMFSRITRVNNYATQCVNEYNDAKNLIEKFVATYSINGYVLDEVTSQSNISQIVIKDKNQETYSLVFNKLTKTIIASILNFNTSEIEENSVQFSNLTDLNFVKQDNLIKCEFFLFF